MAGTSGLAHHCGHAAPCARVAPQAVNLLFPHPFVRLLLALGLFPHRAQARGLRRLQLGLCVGLWEGLRLDALLLQLLLLGALGVVSLGVLHLPADAVGLLLLLAQGALTHRRLVALALGLLLPGQAFLLAALFLLQAELVTPGLDVGLQQRVGAALLGLTKRRAVGAAQNAVIAPVEVAGR